jgi:hypothetical protein
LERSDAASAADRDRCRWEDGRDRVNRDPALALDVEPGGEDRGRRVTGSVAAAERPWPKHAVDELLAVCDGGLVGADVLVEAQRPTGAQDAPQLGERRSLVGYRAENEARYGAVHEESSAGSGRSRPSHLEPPPAASQGELPFVARKLN